MAAVGNDGGIAFSQNAVVDIVGDPQFQNSDLVCVEALDRNFLDSVAGDILVPETFLVERVLFVLVIPASDGFGRVGIGLDELHRHAGRVLAHDPDGTVRQVGIALVGDDLNVFGTLWSRREDGSVVIGTWFSELCQLRRWFGGRSECGTSRDGDIRWVGGR